MKDQKEKKVYRVAANMFISNEVCAFAMKKSTMNIAQVDRKIDKEKVIVSNDYSTFPKWIWQGKYEVETFDKQKLNVKDDTQIFSST